MEITLFIVFDDFTGRYQTWFRDDIATMELSKIDVVTSKSGLVQKIHGASLLLNKHCIKCARIRSYSGLYFPSFGLNAPTFHEVKGTSSSELFFQKDFISQSNCEFRYSSLLLDKLLLEISFMKFDFQLSLTCLFFHNLLYFLSFILMFNSVSVRTNGMHKAHIV